MLNWESSQNWETVALVQVPKWEMVAKVEQEIADITLMNTKVRRGQVEPSETV